METKHLVKSTPKDVFLHLFNILTFYLSVIGFITLFIQYINASFPDPLNYYFTGIADGVRWSTSVLMVAFPAYLLTAWFLAKDLAVMPEKRELKLRKWLLYFTLFISAVTIIIDLMTFVYNFLSGELTIQFFLKILVVLLVAVAVFGYYIWELKRKDLKTKVPKILGVSVSVVVLVSIIIGFFIVGTPADQRDRKFDERRVQDLQMVQSQIVNYWIQKAFLPQELYALEDSISGFVVPTDPDTKQIYEYNIIGELEFELCAKFKALNENLGPNSIYYDPYGSTVQQNWKHRAGRTCFTRTIDPDLYKLKDDNVQVVPNKLLMQ